MKLIAFAYAGGDGHNYYRMKNEVSKSGVELIPYKYRGRNDRIEEGNYASLNEIGREAAEFIKQSLDIEDDYMILGHSMGCIVAFECYQQLVRINYKLPNKVFFSGEYPPHRLNKNKYKLDNDDELVYQLSKLGAITPELLNIPEFRDVFLPIIRNDLRLIENYIFKDAVKIKIPTIVLTGSDDEVKGVEVKDWEQLTIHKPLFIEVKGNHFFLFDKEIEYDFLINHIYQK